MKIWFSAAAVKSLCQTEVQYFEFSVRRNLNVCRLEIPVRNAFIVSRFEAYCDLRAEVQYPLQWYRPFAQFFGEGRSLYKFEDQVWSTIDLHHIVYRRDVGMIQRGQNSCFTLESGPPFRVVGKLVRKCLDGNVTPKTAVAGPINLSHSACPGDFDNLIRPQHASGNKRRRDHFGSRCGQKFRGCLVLAQQRFHLLSNSYILTTLSNEKTFAIFIGLNGIVHRDMDHRQVENCGRPRTRRHRQLQRCLRSNIVPVGHDVSAHRDRPNQTLENDQNCKFFVGLSWYASLSGM